jgi:hypothetical protein
MKDWAKWRLESTNRCVEDVIYDAFRDKSDVWLGQSLIGLWIFDVQSKDIRNLFTKEEQGEIFEQSVKPIPQLADQWEPLFAEIQGASDEGELVRRLSGQLTENSTVEHGGGYWLVSAVLRWKMLCGNNQFNETRSETWWTVNLWSLVFDSLFQLVPGVVFER